MKKKILLILSVFLIMFTLTACGSKESESSKKGSSQIDKYATKINVNMEIKDYGTISLELYPNIAPITVDNFITLVKSGFYDGLTFHRIIDGFMIQGGDPEGNGYGGSEKQIMGEFTANGFQNDLKHERGVISMARGEDPNFASSQFFIVQTTYPSLDGLYASFGRVTSGIEIVDKICEDTPVIDDNGTVLKENQPIITKVYVVE